MNWARWDGEDLLLELKVKARARSDGFGPTQGGRLRVQVRAPAVEGRANSHLQAWLAGQFEVPRQAVSIESGQSSPFKRVRIKAPQARPVGLPSVTD